MDNDMDKLIDEIINSISGTTKFTWPLSGYILIDPEGLHMMGKCGSASGLLFCRTQRGAIAYCTSSDKVLTIQKVSLRKALTIASEKQVDGLILGEQPTKCLLLAEKKPKAVFVLWEVLQNSYGIYSIEKPDSSIVTGVAAFLTGESASLNAKKMFPDIPLLIIDMSLDAVCEAAAHIPVEYVLLVETEDMSTPAIIPV